MELQENPKSNINILSRNDSAEFSYFRCNEGIPFDWEMQPGIPKHPQQQQQQHIPPLTPPPAILSSNLRTPSMSHHPHFSKPSSPNCWPSTKKLRFWKRNTAGEAVILRKQTRSSKKLVREGLQEFDNVDGFAGADNNNKCLSDRESMAMSSLPFDSSFSMFSSSSSSSSGSQSPIRGIRGKPLRSCLPMHWSKIQVSIFARRD
ncbi:hypothetical protein QN277_026528 [Acacia crassicarpa]|uniref:Uncharacterized protein n=1 Tax=Acacia crassicarpa TaxID=499986 RepID=A0AAE1MHH3_9FABA|nr:hypothetical protein QN277_026528 [Acacia crassicarpa]